MLYFLVDAFLVVFGIWHLSIRVLMCTKCIQISNILVQRLVIQGLQFLYLAWCNSTMPSSHLRQEVWPHTHTDVLFWLLSVSVLYFSDNPSLTQIWIDSLSVIQQSTASCVSILICYCLCLFVFSWSLANAHQYQDDTF